MTLEDDAAWVTYGFDQIAVEQWVRTRMGDAVMDDVVERSTRVLEEAIELAQASGVTKEVTQALVDRVYSRKPGDLKQEAAGVIVTLLALCANMSWRLDALAVNEISRIHNISPEHFQSKQTQKAKGGVAKAPTQPKDEKFIVE